MPRCWIALGGNQGRISETFERALEHINQTLETRVIRSSENYTTSPVGASAGGQFLNAAAELETSLTPFELLTQLQTVERALGRVRTLHWGPRTLDLDLLFYGNNGETILDSPTLTLPHPLLWYRRFVLDPLSEIAPLLVHPRIGLTVQNLVQRLEIRPLLCTLSGGDGTMRSVLEQQTNRAFPEVRWITPHSGREIFHFWLGGIPIPESAPVASTINVLSSPTTCWETLQNVLTSALDTVRKANP
jgi:2-amino-4-hydroxy-6-hydroxymethyldihydropteridine diphosphokinase